ncbi:MAG TPA: hypothetical protein VGP55_02815 [Chitinophagaceae bacterium]|nr:hypothetical protein [Chitinophagaceae bacterium]
MKKVSTLFLLGIITTGLLAQSKYPDINIPYKKYVLDNGLTLIVHEDHKAPIIAFNFGIMLVLKTRSRGKPVLPICLSI